MSYYTDYMEEMFFNHVSSVREDLYDFKKWMSDYLDKRSKYPEWVTREGKRIAVGDVDDNHLKNLLNFLPEGTAWHRVFLYEKTYRDLCSKVKELEAIDSYNEEVMNLVY